MLIKRNMVRIWYVYFSGVGVLQSRTCGGQHGGRKLEVALGRRKAKESWIKVSEGKGIEENSWCEILPKN